MAERRALVVKDGRIQELPNGDTLYGVAAGGGGGGSGSPGSAWTLVSSWEYSTPVATIPFLNLGDWEELTIIGRGISWSEAVQRIIQVSADNGATWDTTAVNYPISPEDSNEALPGLGGFFPSSTVTATARGFILNIQNFNKQTIKWQTGPSRAAYRFYLPEVKLNALRVCGVASNAGPLGTVTGGKILIFGRNGAVSANSGALISWANGAGERRMSVGAVATGAVSGNPNFSLGGVPINNFWWNDSAGAQSLTFTFDNANVLTGLLIVQDINSNQGVWNFEGSNDNASWTALVMGFTWTMTSKNNLWQLKLEFANATAFKYYRLSKASGSTSSSAYVNWFVFRCQPII